MSDRQTTASILSRFRAELIEGGFDDDEAFRLVVDAAFSFFSEEPLVVKA